MAVFTLFPYEIEALVALLRDRTDLSRLTSELFHDAVSKLTVPDRLAPLVDEILCGPDWRVRGGAVVLRDAAARSRLRREARGIRVADIMVATDPMSQARLAAVAANIGSGETIVWKGADGKFSTLNAAQIRDIAAAVHQHVQKCFEIEARLAGDIVAGRITSPAQVEDAFKE